MKSTRLKCALSAIILIISSCIFCSCSQKSADQSVTIDMIESIILDNGSFPDMSEVSSKQLAYYFELPENCLSDSIMYIAESESLSDEYGIFEINDYSVLNDVVSSISSHIVNRKASFLMMSELENNKLKNFIINKKDNFIIFAVNEKTTQIAQALKNYGAESIY